MTMQTLACGEAVLLEEYNHRLFNTIQVIAVEIANCARVDNESKMRPLLRHLGERLQALAALHRLLACPSGRGPMEEHCRALCALLVKVFGREDVTPSVRIEDVALARDESLRVPLMIVELVTNCLKHSLTPGIAGTIWVDLRESCGEVELAVCDSSGAPVRPSAAPRILLTLASSLSGKVSVLDRDGYTAVVRFPLAARPWETAAPAYTDRPPISLAAARPHSATDFAGAAISDHEQDWESLRAVRA